MDAIFLPETNPWLKWMLERELDTESWTTLKAEAAVCWRRFACIKVYKQKSIVDGKSGWRLLAKSGRLFHDIKQSRQVHVFKVWIRKNCPMFENEKPQNRLKSFQ